MGIDRAAAVPHCQRCSRCPDVPLKLFDSHVSNFVRNGEFSMLWIARLKAFRFPHAPSSRRGGFPDGNDSQLRKTDPAHSLLRDATPKKPLIQFSSNRRDTGQSALCLMPFLRQKITGLLYHKPTFMVHTFFTYFLMTDGRKPCSSAPSAVPADHGTVPHASATSSSRQAFPAH